MFRLDHYYRSVYDSLQRKVEEQKISKEDTSVIDSTFFAYDQHGNVVKETSVYYYGEERNEFVMQYSYEYNDRGLVTKKCQLEEGEDGKWNEILLNEYIYKEDGESLDKILQYMDGEVAITEFFQYGEQGLLIRKDIDDPTWFERVNMMKIKPRPDISEQYITYSHNEDNQIIEVYQHFSDSCLSMDDYYAYRYSYLPNGLIEGIEIWEKRQKMVSKVRFDYK